MRGSLWNLACLFLTRAPSLCQIHPFYFRSLTSPLEWLSLPQSLTEFDQQGLVGNKKSVAIHYYLEGLFEEDFSSTVVIASKIVDIHCYSKGIQKRFPIKSFREMDNRTLTVSNKP